MGSPRLTFTRLTRRGPAPSLSSVTQLTQPSTSEVTPPVSKAVSPLPVCLHLHNRCSGQETGDMIHTIEFISPQLGSSSPHPHICYSPGCRRQSSNSWSTSSSSSGTSHSSNRSSDTGNNSSPLLPSAGACRCFVPFKKSVKDNIDRVTPRFSGMSLGDVMKVTVMQEMEQLNMERSKPLDLSCKAISFSMKN